MDKYIFVDVHDPLEVKNLCCKQYANAIAHDSLIKVSPNPVIRFEISYYGFYCRSAFKLFA